MGKNRDRESLIRMLVNVIVHKIVIVNTNKPESKSFLNSEIIEYRGQTEKLAISHKWNDEDKMYVFYKVVKKAVEKLESKYSDVSFRREDVEKLEKNEIWY